MWWVTERMCNVSLSLSQDLDNETLLHVDAENRRQTLEEELEFLKQVHEQVGVLRICS